jgi:outer membrane protein OmpA-like peptidoglycan-associated protein
LFTQKFLNIGKMKRTLLILVYTLPLFLSAQTNSYFLKNVAIEVEKTDINTTESDFGPAFVGDELWFSAFSGEEIAKLQQGNSKDVYYNIYASPVDSKGNLRGGKEVKLQGISAGYHAGPVSYCEQTGELFVTLSNYENPEIKNVVFQKANIPLQIIILKKSGSSWSRVADIPFNSSTYSVGHPAISASGDTLFFASNIPDKGYGGTDLYMTVRENGRWGEMQNLGEDINTNADDMFPYLYGKRLIYASAGRPDGEGGLDIYFADIERNGFGSPENFTELNSSEDDFGLVIHADDEVGYYTSRKSGGMGSDDIYKVLFEGQYDLELLVRDTKSGDPMPNVQVAFNDGKTLTTNSMGMITRDLEKNTDYVATTELDGYMNDSKTFSTENQPYGTMKVVLNVEKVEVGQKFVMENIYYDFDKWNILPESEVELNKLVKIMKDNPSWKVELGSHTDSRGSDAYNEKLSRKRSESAVNFIVSQGISRNRITAKGYGETQLVNECDDGMECTEEQHRKNRRTEFKILRMD